MSLETFEKLPADKKERILNAGIAAFSRKPYMDVSTDSITKQCQISKGILFHYFGSKKQYYLYCLKKAMERLTEKTEEAEGTDFYEILFSEMNRKMALCMDHKEEMHMVNMASREAASEIGKEKAEIFHGYAAAIHMESERTLRKAISALSLRDENKTQITEKGLQMYVTALMNRYLLQYQQTPDQFFENSETIKGEMKRYLDLMLYGICNQEGL